MSGPLQSAAPARGGAVDTGRHEAGQGDPRVSAHDHPNQFSLLSQRRIAPFLCTHALGPGTGTPSQPASPRLLRYQLQGPGLPPSHPLLVT